MANHHELANFIWQIADLLRGPYRPPQYERVMLPMTVLRRFDCVLAPTKVKVLADLCVHDETYRQGQLSHRARQAREPLSGRSGGIRSGFLQHGCVFSARW